MRGRANEQVPCQIAAIGVMAGGLSDLAVGSSARRASVLERHEHHPIEGLVNAVDDQQPGPRARDDATTRVPSGEGPAEGGIVGERLEGLRHAKVSGGWQRPRPLEPPKLDVGAVEDHDGRHCYFQSSRGMKRPAA